MERLHCSLTSLLEKNSDVPIGIKLSIVYDVALGLRYLHSHSPPIIHRDLSSNNILVSKGMEGKIGDLGTVRLVDTSRQSQMSKAPGTVDFMPPEALAASENIKYEKELDVFSFGCVMLHTLSHKWPTPSEPVVVDPLTSNVKGRTEVERRKDHFDKIDQNRLELLVALITKCLDNIPKSRPSMVQVSRQLNSLIEREYAPTEDLVASISQHNKIQDLTTRLHDKDAEIQTLKSALSKLQIASSTQSSSQATEKSIDFWKSLELKWQQCADLPAAYWATSVAELNSKVYVAVRSSKCAYAYPLMYDSSVDKWSSLPHLPYAQFSLVTVPNKNQLLAIGGSVLFGGIVTEVSNKVFLWDEKHQQWLTPYPGMSTPRWYPSCISYKLTVIVVGGVTYNNNPWTTTRAVEVLRINESNLPDSYWSVVAPLPYGVYEAVPLVIKKRLYIAAGFGDTDGACSIVTASLPKLLQSSNSSTSSDQVWKNLPNMRHCSLAINHYQGRLITFTGDYEVNRPGESKCVLDPQIHIYNSDTNSWDCVGEVPNKYYLGRSIHIGEDKILFITGLTGDHVLSNEDNLMPSCLMLVLKPCAQ